MIEGVHTAPSGRLIGLGKIVGTHGVRGLLRFHPANEASAASAVEASGHNVFLRSGPSTGRGSNTPRPAKLLSARPHGRMVLMEIDDIKDIDDAAKLVGLELAVPESELPAPAADEYYTYQLEGLEVVTVAGVLLGTVASVMPTGSNDVLTVRGTGREYLIPVIKDVIRSIDIDAGRVTIEPMEGLLD